MILAIDIGNTHIVIGCFQEQTILFQERMATDAKATSLQYASMLKTALEMHELDRHQIDGCILSSVVPPVTGTVRQAVSQYIGIDPMLVRYDMKTDLQIVISYPEKLGNDLIVDAVAAMNAYPLPLIIIDMGTATTLSVINAERQYLGGVILPGIGVSHDALISGTAQLPKIALEPPEHVIGTNTVDCMKSGLLFGTACTLDGLIDRIQTELQQTCTVVATGGLAAITTPLCQHSMILDEDLLLKGLQILYYKNK